MNPVEVRYSEGEARIAGHRVPIAAEGRGLRILVPGGVWLRPLTFGERGRLARSVADGENSVQALSRAILQLSSPDCAATDQSSLVAEILALHLAGGGSGAPGFAEEVGLLGRWLGWSPVQIEAADAADVDSVALAFGLAQRAREEEAGPGDGWVSLRLEGPSGESIGAASDLEELRERLSGDLLQRARALPDLNALRAAPNQPATAFSELPTEAPHRVPQPHEEGQSGEDGGGHFGTSAGEISAAGSHLDAVRRASDQAATPAWPAIDAGHAPVSIGPTKSGGGTPATSRPTEVGAGMHRSAPPERTPLPTTLEKSTRPAIAGAPAWTPEADAAGPRDALTPERLASIYPAIFGGRTGASLPHGRFSERSVTSPGGAAGWGIWADGFWDGWPPHSTGAGGEAIVAPWLMGTPAPSTTSSAGADEVARALHRAADLRGVAP